MLINIKLKKKLAIFSPNENAYSETFIQAHKNLPFSILFYHSGYLPTQLENRYDLSNFSRKEKLEKKLYKRFNEKEYGLYYSLKRENAACVLAEYGPCACETLTVVKALRLPLIVHFHGFDTSVKSVLEEYKIKYKEVFDYAFSIIAVSKKMKENLIDLGCPEHKILLSTYGPNPVFFECKPEYLNKQFIAAGRFAEKKGPHLTILAFKKISEKYQDLKLVIAGEGTLLPICRDIVKALDIGDKVEFTGVVTPQQLKGLFEQSICFLQHSVTAESGDSEGTPVAIIEAQAAALPVIATWHAGIPDILVNEETGFLVPEHDVDSMATCMEKIVSNPTLAEKMGSQGRKRIKEFFTMDMHLATLAKKIEEAINLN